MDLGVAGKIALITGAGRGLGNSIAQCLAREGAIVLATSRTEADLVELLGTIGGPAKGHAVLPLDLQSAGGTDRLLDWLKQRGAIPDIVVHNVGGNLGVTDPLCSLEEWQRVMQFNVDIPVALNRVLIPAMQEKRWGRVCHVSSISALENQGPPAYCAAKAALVAYTRSLGRFVSPQNVIVTAILPGAVFTEGGYWDTASRERPDHVARYLKERMAIQRFGQPDEIGNVVAFLCSEQASFCVGSSFLADGGQGRVFFAQE